jgi:tRNA A-37 threonylcarbamoyl transferase component Bud32
MAEQVLGGRYRITRHIARGGMAEVYLAHDDLLDRPVAVKVLFPELARDPAFVERFRREAQSAARLNHPNIVSVYDFGEDGEAFYIVMEYVAGQTLSDMIRAEGAMAPGHAIDLAAQIAAGLAAAHGEGIVHRDVKPANVLIAAGVAKVADFGIARAADTRSDLTMPGAVIGTATYLSPEQAQGYVVDARSDLYSLGMVLYEMLTGRAPFRGDTPLTVAVKQQHETPPPPSTVNPAVPAQLDAVVARAMSLDPADRQRSAGELRAELLAVGHGPVTADATVAFGPAATSVLPVVGGALGAAAAGGSVMAPPSARAGIDGVGARSRRPKPPGVYGRRRLVALGLVVLVVVGVIVVVLALKSGGTSTAVVPLVVGRSVADATAAISGAGLKSTVVEQNRPGPPGQVADQLPAAQTRVGGATVVTLFVPSATTTTRAPSVASTRPTTRATTTSLAPTTVAPATTVATIPGTSVPGTTPSATTPSVTTPSVSTAPP